MTYEQAYAIWNGDTKATADEYMEMTKLVSDAILKQIPKEPKITKIATLIDTPEKITWGKSFTCPVCGETVKQFGRCSNRFCGQQIKWND